MGKKPKASQPPTDEIAAEREPVRRRVTDLVIETAKRIEKLSERLQRLRDEEEGGG
jgi:hypothetical protein